MIDQAEAIPGEVGSPPDPLAVTRRIARTASWCAVGLVVVLVVLGIVFRHSLTWGDVPTWVMAITTLLAFLAAAFAGLVAYDLLKVETARDLKATEDRRIAEAERAARGKADERKREADERVEPGKCTAWFGRFDIDRDGAKVGTWGAIIRNASNYPMLDVRVSFYWVNYPDGGKRWTAEERYTSPDRFPVIPPGQTRNRELPERIRNMAGECNDEVYLVSIEWVDSTATRVWRRDERGILRLVSVGGVW